MTLKENSISAKTEVTLSSETDYLHWKRAWNLLKMFCIKCRDFRKKFMALFLPIVTSTTTLRNTEQYSRYGLKAKTLIQNTCNCQIKYHLTLFGLFSQNFSYRQLCVQNFFFILLPLNTHEAAKFHNFKFIYIMDYKYSLQFGLATIFVSGKMYDSDDFDTFRVTTGCRIFKHDFNQLQKSL